MPFKVTDIIESIKSKGVLKTSKFDVIIGEGDPDLTLRCISASLPGINLTTSDFKLYGGMPTLKIPTGRNYNDVRLTFLMQADGSDRYYFENWMNRITNFTTNTVDYYDSVAKDIFVTVYDEVVSVPVTTAVSSGFAGQPGPPTISTTASTGYQVAILGAIPTNIDEIDLSWADNDRLVEYTVTLSYEQLQLTSNPKSDNFMV